MPCSLQRRLGGHLFFVLSSFLITWLLLTEIRKKCRINVGAFYMRRVLRIWPLYAVVMLVGIVIMPQIYKLAHQQIFFDYKVPLYVAFLSNYGVLALNPASDAIRSYSLIMNITWSVSIEEQFYVIWPLFFLLPRKLRRFVPVLFIVVSIMAAVIYAHNARQLYSSSFTRIGEIATGALFAVAAFMNERFLKFIQQLPRGITILIYLFSFLVIYISFRFEWQPPIIGYGLHMLGAVLFSFIILEQNFSQRSLFKFGRLRILGSLGKVSYGLYMLHPVAMFAASVGLQLLLHQNAQVVKGPAYMALAFCLAVAFSYLSYYVL